MANLAFIILRIVAAIAALGGLAAIILVIVFTTAVTLVKGGAGAIASVAKLFASGFRDAGSMPPQDGYLVPPPLVGLAIMFLGMFASVFIPGQKVFLHIVAAMAVIFGVWRLWTVPANPESPLFYVPAIALWFLYYAVCLRR